MLIIFLLFNFLNFAESSQLLILILFFIFCSFSFNSIISFLNFFLICYSPTIISDLGLNRYNCVGSQKNFFRKVFEIRLNIQYIGEQNFEFWMSRLFYHQNSIFIPLRDNKNSQSTIIWISYLIIKKI